MDPNISLRILIVGALWLTSRASPISSTEPGTMESIGDSHLRNSSHFNSEQYMLLVQDQRKRDKERRLSYIKHHLLSTLGFGKVPSPQGPLSGVGGANKASQRPFSGVLSTFPPSCDIPLNVASDVWNAPGYFHLFFNLTGGVTNGTNPNGSSQESIFPSHKTTISAKLRLYKLGVGDSDSPVFEFGSGGEPWNDTIVERFVSGSSLIPNGEALPILENKIRVSLYWYRAPVTKHHYKKKLLDTKMFSVRESKWVEFDILNAAAPWLDQNQENFGLVLQVENEDNDLVDPNKYFVNSPCTATTGNVSDRVTLPTLEICTLSTPAPSSREVEREAPAFFPFPMGQSFSYLNRVAQAHAAANSGTISDWQNDELRMLTPDQGSHRHRHRHGGRSTTKQTRHASSSSFILNEDHPLRQILEMSGHESRIPGSGVNEDRDDDEDEGMIIQKIYISSPSSQDSLNR